MVTTNSDSCLRGRLFLETIFTRVALLVSLSTIVPKQEAQNFYSPMIPRRRSSLFILSIFGKYPGGVDYGFRLSSSISGGLEVYPQ